MHFILMRAVIGLKLLQGEEQYDSLSTRKGATLSARLQWTPHMISSNYGMGTFVIVSINLCSSGAGTNRALGAPVWGSGCGFDDN